MAEATDHFDVLIVGAGLSGIGAGYHLQTKCPGKSYVILDGRDCIGGTWDLFRVQRPTFETFWLESMQRHANISLSKASDIVVPSRTVRPSLLMQEDLTDNPHRLPNDCVAAFYGKSSVVMR
jgi:cation diffusion facilitator CzcD-associated flavoprotein CzcO